jgi:hypothetical protein
MCGRSASTAAASGTANSGVKVTHADEVAAAREVEAGAHSPLVGAAARRCRGAGEAEQQEDVVGCEPLPTP